MARPFLPPPPKLKGGARVRVQRPKVTADHAVREETPVRAAARGSA